MSKTEKLIEKLINPTVVMTWDDLTTLLGRLGYTIKQGDGSLHKPHPSNELKRYVKTQVIEKLKLRGYL